MQSLAFEKHFPHPPSKVWQALTTREALAEWLMPNDFEPVVGRVFRFTYPRNDCEQQGSEQDLGVVLVEVEQISPPKRMVWLWRNTDQGETTRVIFTLHPTTGGTLLRLDHTDIATADEVTSLNDGWPGKLDALADLFSH